jgi:DNA-binding Lrp family transcriptional regulator
MHETWWSDLERELMKCMDSECPVPVPDLAARLGLSESAVNSLVALLAQEGKVRITAVRRVA